jgi:pimeloyl-ACP methyl ester carboxylesterase
MDAGSPRISEAARTPEWFEWALQQRPAESSFELGGAQIELLSWGERGKPGVLLLHGNWAHAGWWRHIAPHLALDYRVAAISWSGMGGSSWRTAYSTELFVQEAIEGARSAGLFEAGSKPVIVGHSFGGDLAWACAAREGQHLRATVTIDSVGRTRDERPPPMPRSHRIHASLAEAIATYRLVPRGSLMTPYIVNMIAHHAFKQVEADGQRGWTLAFDPDLWSHYRREDSFENIQAARCPLVAIWADMTASMPDSRVPRTRAAMPAGSICFEIPDSSHHIMVDQPLALIGALRGVLGCLLPTG